VVALTKNAADELGPRGISAMVVHPGVVRTEKTAGVVASRAQQLGVSPEEVLAGMSRNLIGRLVDASDIANLVAFLCSPKAIAINGTVVEAGGGVAGPIYY
jgi:NAD(P)-dependent dehydrogenase (short-subunit alcohol dehydrogenase family)